MIVLGNENFYNYKYILDNIYVLSTYKPPLTNDGIMTPLFQENRATLRSK